MIIVAFRGRHTWSHPQLPLSTTKNDLEVVLKKGKASKEEDSTVEPGNPPSPSVGTPFSPPQFLNRSFSELSYFLNFGSVPAEFSPPGLGLEGEILVTPLSFEVLLWKIPRTPEDFPTPIFTTPPLVTVAPSAQREASADLSPLAFSLNPLLFPVPL
jgi:hypothetical protein